MKVLFLCQRDWANHSFIMTQCLNEVGINSQAVTTHPNKIKFPEHALLCKSSSKLNSIIAKSNIIIFMHSQFVGTDVNLKKKKILVFHTGSKYRQHSGKMNSIFNPIVSATLTAADTFNLGGINEKYVVVPVDTKKLLPDYTTSDKLVIAHYPSGNKGKETIKEVVATLGNNFVFQYDNTRIDWISNIKRISECDIYIEDLREHQKGKVTSGFGLTALEAASLGKIVVTRLTYLEKYEKELGKCAIQVANNKEELKTVLTKLLNMNKSEIIKLKQESRNWVERLHSYKSVGNMFKRIFEEL